MDKDPTITQLVGLLEERMKKADALLAGQMKATAMQTESVRKLDERGKEQRQILRQNRKLIRLLKDVRTMLKEREQSGDAAKECFGKIAEIYKHFKTDAPLPEKKKQSSKVFTGARAGYSTKQELKQEVIDGLTGHAKQYGLKYLKVYDMSESEFNGILSEFRKFGDYSRYFIKSKNISRVYRYDSALVPKIVERMQVRGVCLSFILDRISGVAKEKKRSLLHNRLATIERRIANESKDMLMEYPLLYKHYHDNYDIKEKVVIKRHDGLSKLSFPIDVALELIKYISKHKIDEERSAIQKARRAKENFSKKKST